MDSIDGVEREKAEREQQELRQNSVQLNIVTLVDVDRAVRTGSLAEAVFMMDNSIGRTGQGTARLSTVCKQGQVLNWIIRPIDGRQRADGGWPPVPRINNIVFLEDGRGDVEETKVCDELKIYGMPDRVRSPLTPVYYYWAGEVLHDLAPGVYPYRLVVELEREGGAGPLYLNTEERPSLRVTAVSPAR